MGGGAEAVAVSRCLPSACYTLDFSFRSTAVCELIFMTFIYALRAFVQARVARCLQFWIVDSSK